MRRRLTFLLLALAFVGTVIACSAKSQKTDTLCKPDQPVYCTCADLSHGTKTCNEDGDAFGKCDPCETDENPEIPNPPGTSSGVEPSGDAGVDGAKTTGCGNKLADPGEDCDDGNTNESDGCNTSCKLAG